MRAAILGELGALLVLDKIFNLIVFLKVLFSPTVTHFSAPSTPKTHSKYEKEKIR